MNGWFLILYSFIASILLSSILIHFLNEEPFSLPTDTTVVTNEKCCGGNYCTDTYYDAEKDKCILTLCEGAFLIFNKSRCEYEPQ